jgi:hypothetical protein
MDHLYNWIIQILYTVVLMPLRKKDTRCIFLEAVSGMQRLFDAPFGTQRSLFSQMMCFGAFHPWNFIIRKTARWPRLLSQCELRTRLQKRVVAPTHKSFLPEQELSLRDFATLDPKARLDSIRLASSRGRA